MEPVEIDIRMKQNVSEESKKASSSTSDFAAATARAKAEIERHLVAVKELRKDLVGLGADYKSATSKSQKSAILDDIELTKKNIIDEREAIRLLKNDLVSLSKVKTAPALDAQNVARSGMAYGGLNMSVQQVVRELPAASMGLNMFFLAIGNNIPILTDQIKRARLENDALKASGASTVPVWKQLIGSIFSWQSLMMVGITVATMYGKQIFQAFSKGSEAAERAKETTKKFNEAFAQSAADPLAKLNQLADRWNKLGGNLEEKKKFVDANKEAFKELGVEVNNVRDAENLLVENVDAFRQAMIAKAMSVAAMKIATDKYQEYFKKMREAEQMPDTVKLVTGSGQSVTGGGSMQTTTVTNRTKTDTKAAAAAIKAEGDALITESNKQNDLYAELMKKAGIKVLEDDKNTRERGQRDIYNSERDFLDLIYDLHVKSGDMLLDLQEDSLVKRLAAIEREKQAELKAVEEKQVAIIDAYNKSQKQQVEDWNKDNPKNKKTFTPLSTASGSIGASLAVINPAQAKELLKAIEEINASFRAKSADATLEWQDEMLALGVKYGDERTRLEKEYTDRITKLAQAGFITQAAELRVELNRKLSSLEAQNVKETNLFQLASDTQLRISKKLSDELIAEVKRRIEANKELSREDKDKLIGKLNDTELVKATTAVDGLIKAFTGLRKAKKEAAAAEAMGDLEGAANAASNIGKLQDSLSKYGNEILNYFDQASAGIIGIMDQLGSFTESEKKDAENIVGMVSGAGDLAVGIASGNVGQIIKGTISLVSNAIEFFDFKSKNIAKQQEALKDNVDNLTESYGKLQRAVEKAFGTEQFKAQADEVRNLQARLSAYQDLISLENQKKKKKRDQEAIAEWQQNITDIQNQIEDVITAVTDALLGSDIQSIVTQLGESFVDVFANSADAASAWGEKVDEIVNGIVRNLIVQTMLETPLANLVKSYTSKWVDGSGNLTATTQQIAADTLLLKSDLNDFYAKYGADVQNMVNQFMTSTTARTGASQGIATASQDSINELSGGVYALRLSVADIRNIDREKLIVVQIISGQLDVLIQNTAPILGMADKIEAMADDIADIKIKGIFMKL